MKICFYISLKDLFYFYVDIVIVKFIGYT